MGVKRSRTLPFVPACEWTVEAVPAEQQRATALNDAPRVRFNRQETRGRESPILPLYNLSAEVVNPVADEQTVLTQMWQVAWKIGNWGGKSHAPPKFPSIRSKEVTERSKIPRK